MENTRENISPEKRIAYVQISLIPVPHTRTISHACWLPCHNKLHINLIIIVSKFHVRRQKLQKSLTGKHKMHKKFIYRRVLYNLYFCFYINDDVVQLKPIVFYRYYSF
jgi:hypothetical protein